MNKNIPNLDSEDENENEDVFATSEENPEQVLELDTDETAEELSNEDEPPADKEEDDVVSKELDFLEEDEEEDNEDEELKSLNEKFNTDFKSLEEMKNSLKGIENKSEQDTDDVELKKAQTNVNTFNDLIAFDDERLVRQNLRAEAQQAGDNLTDQEVKDSIEAKIEALKDSDTLKSVANSVRSALSGFVKENQAKVDAITGKRTAATEKTAKENTEALQNAMATIFKNKEFYGVTVTKDIITKTYKSVQDGSFFKKANADQELMAELALFATLKGEIQKKAGGPTHSDGIKKVLDEIGIKDGQKRSIARTTPASKEAAADLIKSWTQ